MQRLADKARSYQRQENPDQWLARCATRNATAYVTKAFTTRPIAIRTAIRTIRSIDPHYTKHFFPGHFGADPAFQCSLVRGIASSLEAVERRVSCRPGT
jgi:hypothetical protein